MQPSESGNVVTTGSVKNWRHKGMVEIKASLGSSINSCGSLHIVHQAEWVTVQVLSVELDMIFITMRSAGVKWSREWDNLKVNTEIPKKKTFLMIHRETEMQR